ncbi:MAG: hypothetical protein WCX65_13365 [bacterium]
MFVNQSSIHFKNTPAASHLIPSEPLRPNPNGGFGFISVAISGMRNLLCRAQHAAPNFIEMYFMFDIGIEFGFAASAAKRHPRNDGFSSSGLLWQTAPRNDELWLLN